MLEKIIGLWALHKMTIRTLEHLSMFGIALLLSIIIGVLLGILVYWRPRFANSLFNVLNVIETIPALALLVLLLPAFGLGAAPTIAASVLYSILPIARNTYTGLTTVRREYIEVGQALGMTKREILIKIKIPMALPLIAGGIRIAIVFTMGVITLGGLIAAGGLGAPLQTGIHLYNKPLIILTGIWVAILALMLDGVGNIVEKGFSRKFRHGIS